ncbi:protein phosphatase 2C domain-containing protein [Nocardiopsis aegyptia]|uniref:protein phosphatase 2C domain-containing protein n=1 Tax=Nocardiopsis aegyptia TaxID=220378 RepID=UPI00366AE338
MSDTRDDRPETGTGSVEGVDQTVTPEPRGASETEKAFARALVPSGYVPPEVLTRPTNPGFHARGLPTMDWAVPDTVVDEADYPGLLLRAASLRGDKQRFQGKCRQDAFGLSELEHEGERFVLACVADGVGSKSMSHRGANYACRLLGKAVADFLPGLLTDGASSHRSAAIARVLERIKHAMLPLVSERPGELSTTLTVALVSLTPVGEPSRAVLFSVGDSPAYRLGEDGFEALTEVDESGPVMDSTTDALPVNFEAAFETECELKPGQMLLLCTDGLSGPMSGSTDVSDRLAQWWGGASVPGRLEFGCQMDFQAKSYDDDRTAVCLWVR